MAKTRHGTALVTGASSGIGAVYADRLAHRGFDLVLVARDLARLDALAVRLRDAAGIAVTTLKADLTHGADLQAVEERLRNDLSITLLLNNAGIGLTGPLAGAEAGKLDALILLNVLAPTRLAAAVLPGFLDRGRGTLINISSVLALAPERFNGPYSGTKAYLLNLTQNLQQEVAGKDIRVQAVLPGATRTEIWDRSGTGVANLPPSMLMEVDELVDAALVGLDRGEAVTIPSLPDAADWEALVAARQKLGPNLSRNAAAARFKA